MQRTLIIVCNNEKRFLMDFILKTVKRKLPLYENSFVKATAPFLLFAEIKTILQRIAVIVPGHPGSCIC